MNLLSGQTVFLTAVVTQPLRYIAVDRDALRALLFDDGPLSDLVLSTFITRREALQRVEGHRHRDRRAALVRGDDADARVRARKPASVHLARGRRRPDGDRGRRSCAFPAAPSCSTRRAARSCARSGSAASSRRARRSTCSSSAAARPASPPPSTAPPRGSTRWSSRAPRSAGRPDRRAGSRTTSASPPASAAPSSRAAPSPRRASSAPGPATPYRAIALEPGDGRHVVRLEEDHEIAARAVVLATGADYRRLPVDGLADYEGSSVFYAAGPPEAQLCGASRVAVVGGGNSAGQAAVWLARGGALVTLLHRRADLRETMSDYLIRELERYGVAVRDRSEIAALHGTDGQLEAVTLKSGERLPFSFLFLFLGAQPCTEWLDDAVARARRRLHPHRRRRRRRGPARDERARHLRGRRRPLRIDQALRRRRRRRFDGRAVRPRAPGGFRSASLRERSGRVSFVIVAFRRRTTRGNAAMRMSALAVALVALAFALSGPGSATAAPPVFGPNVIVLKPATAAAADPGDARRDLDAAGAEPVRVAALRVFFQPGTYGSAANPLVFQVGYYTQVAGLGAQPSDVVINGAINVFSQCDGSGACDGLEQLLAVGVEPDAERAPAEHAAGVRAGARRGRRLQNSNDLFAVSQASPVRRVIVNGTLPAGLLQPGVRQRRVLRRRRVQRRFVGNFGQQQYFTRNSNIDHWSNGVWNQVFLGDNGAPATAFGPGQTSTRRCRRTPVSRGGAVPDG